MKRADLKVGMIVAVVGPAVQDQYRTQPREATVLELDVRERKYGPANSARVKMLNAAEEWTERVYPTRRLADVNEAAARWAVVAEKRREEDQRRRERVNADAAFLKRLSAIGLSGAWIEHGVTGAVTIPRDVIEKHLGRIEGMQQTGWKAVKVVSS